jgi:GntR family transcriptional regulator of arabinose operon
VRKKKWELLAEKLRSDILSGVLKPGDRLPPEDRLVAEWNVCRATVHRVMQQIKKDGLIVRRRRAGTVVANGAGARKSSFALIFEHEQRILERHYIPAFHEAVRDESLATFMTRGNPVVEAQVLSTVIREFGGAVIFPSCDPDNNDLIRRIVADGYPLVCVDRVPDGLDVDAFVTDNYGAATEGLQYLIGRGHRRIAHFTEDRMHVPPVRERFEAFVDAVTAAGEKDPTSLVRAFQYPAHWGYLVQSCYDALYTMFHDSDPITAVFCLEESYMAAVQEACVRLGVSVPEDFEILSFCDLPDWMVRNPTAVHRIQQQLRLTASLAAERLLAKMRGDQHPPEVIRIPAIFRPAEKIARLTYLGKHNGPSAKRSKSSARSRLVGPFGVAEE